MTEIRAAEPVALGFALFLIAATLPLVAIQWRIYLPASQKPKPSHMLRATAVAVAAWTVLPLCPAIW